MMIRKNKNSDKWLCEIIKIIAIRNSGTRISVK